MALCLNLVASFRSFRLSSQASVVPVLIMFSCFSPCLYSFLPFSGHIWHVLISDPHLFKRHVLINNLSQQCTQEPCLVINVIEYFTNMPWCYTQVLLELLFIVVLSRSKSNYLGAKPCYLHMK